MSSGRFKYGVADYGMNVWEGGCFDLEKRLLGLKSIGYQGIERMEAKTPGEALQNALTFHKNGMDFATCRGPRPEVDMQWTAALGKEYVWVCGGGNDFETFCRHARKHAEACAKLGIKTALHNHLGAKVESQEELESFLNNCPNCGLLLDTGHLAAAGGDCLEIVNKYADRLVAVHLKDWLEIDPSIGWDKWYERGRFCELGAGNIGQDNGEVLKALDKIGYQGWVFIEHDTHLREPLEDLKVSMDYMKNAGF
jgi:hypothetical protein